jgi:hypothetical protein
LTAFVVLGVILLVVDGVAFRLIEMRSRMGTLLYRVEAKLDLLLKQANIKFDPYANLPSEFGEALRAGQGVKAITCNQLEWASKSLMILLKSSNGSLESSKYTAPFGAAESSNGIARPSVLFAYE